MVRKSAVRMLVGLCWVSILVACGAPEPEAETDVLSLIAQGRWLDLSHEFSETTLYWPTADGFEHRVDFQGMTDKGYYYESFQISTSEHGGTHLDAPIHFAEGRQDAAEVPLSRLIGGAVVIDVAAQAARQPDWQIDVESVTHWEAEHGRIADGAIVLFNTGWHLRWPDARRYLGTEERGPEAVAELHFPGISPVLARWLVAQRSVAAVGIDTASIDFGQSTHYEAHRILFEQNIPAFENVANLGTLPPKGALVVALPMKIRDGSGGPLRIVAWLPGR